MLDAARSSARTRCCTQQQPGALVQASLFSAGRMRATARCRANVRTCVCAPAAPAPRTAAACHAPPRMLRAPPIYDAFDSPGLCTRDAAQACAEAFGELCHRQVSGTRVPLAASARLHGLVAQLTRQCGGTRASRVAAVPHLKQVDEADEAGTEQAASSFGQGIGIHVGIADTTRASGACNTSQHTLIRS